MLPGIEYFKKKLDLHLYIIEMIMCRVLDAKFSLCNAQPLYIIMKCWNGS